MEEAQPSLTELGELSNNYQRITALLPRATLDKTLIDLQKQVKAAENDTDLIVLTRLLPKNISYTDLFKAHNGLIEGSERFNAAFAQIIEHISDSTTFLNPYTETSVIKWILRGFPRESILDNGTLMRSADNVKFAGPTSKGDAGGQYDFKYNRLIFGGIITNKVDFLQDLLKRTMSENVETIQHEAAHSLHYPQGISKMQRLIAKSPPFISSIVEPFACRMSNLPIDICSPDDLNAHIANAKDTKGGDLYITVPEHLESAIKSIDHLSAIYSIHPDIGPMAIVRTLGDLVLKVAQGKNAWDGQYFVLFKKEINQRCTELNITSIQQLDELTENYSIVQKIQRLGASIIVDNDLQQIAKSN